jgi:hypothetical protein
VAERYDLRTADETDAVQARGEVASREDEGAIVPSTTSASIASVLPTGVSCAGPMNSTLCKRAAKWREQAAITIRLSEARQSK